MSRQDDCRAFVVKFPHIGPERPAQFHIDTRCWLVENQDGGIVDEGLGHHQATFHAARQLAHIGILLVIEPDGCEDFKAAALRFRHAVKTSHQFKHFQRREEGIGNDFLIDHSDGCPTLAWRFVDIQPPNARRTRRLVYKASQNVDKGRFSRTVRTKQSEDRATRNLQIQAL